jgi:uncharacterized membrane protein (UPF0127 family)
MNENSRGCFVNHRVAIIASLLLDIPMRLNWQPLLAAVLAGYLVGVSPAIRAQQPQLPEIPLTIRGHALKAEVAATDATRMQGLMHRRMLPENYGMLFVFPQATTLSFWMQNTYLALSIAFLDDSGTIINIEDMKPLTTDTHHSARPARYALEMNQGWFKKRGIKPGDRIEGLIKAPPGQ